MSADYLDWLADVFEEAQIPLTPQTAEHLDRACHDIAGVSYPQTSEGEVLAVLRERFLALGPPGYQLLAAYLRDRVYGDRRSPFRPQQGVGYYTNEAEGYE